MRKVNTHVFAEPLSPNSTADYFHLRKIHHDLCKPDFKLIMFGPVWHPLSFGWLTSWRTDPPKQLTQNILGKLWTVHPAELSSKGSNRDM